MSEPHVVVFLGPSMPVEHAQRLLDADYRPPIRRGNLDGISPGTVIALIDGVFEQNLSVSPREVQEAISRGVVVFGGASMGALRAAEVPGVRGVGRIFEWYRDEVITRDDEVALLFAEDTGRALTVPTVNVRFAVERLCRLGTINPTVAEALISAALGIHYKERTYRRILEVAGLSDHWHSGDLIEMLQAHDLKYRDAQAVLEAVDLYLQRPVQHSLQTHWREAGRAASPIEASIPWCQSAEDEVLVWESGDRATHAELIEFLGLTGRLEELARTVASSSPLAARAASADGNPASSDAQTVFNSAARRWGWVSAEEARVTLSDLGLTLEHVNQHCLREAKLAGDAFALIREGGHEFRSAVIASLFLDGLALKRETMRLGGLRALASRGKLDPSCAELDEARTVLCKVNGEFTFAAVRRQWARMGFVDEAAQELFVRLIATARRVSRELSLLADGEAVGDRPRGEGLKHFKLGPCPKPEGEPRFCSDINAAEVNARRIGQVIGVTRIGMIGELGELGGIQIAQAARPGNAWSSSYGSGKSLCKAGAIVGSIMEEAEKWAQEQFDPQESQVVGSYAELSTTGRFIDPATLDLPYDSVYHPQLSLQWYPCIDLLSSRELYLPIDGLQMTCRKHDIYFTRRGARKHLATNGLGSGFSREEAVLHGLCEYVERHAQRIAELLISNPGGLGAHHYQFVDLSTASASVRDLAERLSSPDSAVRVLDITSEVRIPTFMATITRQLRRADGYGAHPNPNTAIEMALLEAAQTIASAAAGGREDLSINARSLGRHERPRPASVRDAWFWLDPDPIYKPIQETMGLYAADVFVDLAWCLDRLQEAGVKHVLAVELTPSGIAPASVVRIIAPGLETNNPFYTGPRARRLLLYDLLPKQWSTK